MLNMAELGCIKAGQRLAQRCPFAVTAMRLGACWVGGFEEKPVKEILGLAENQTVMTPLPVGYFLKETGGKGLRL